MDLFRILINRILHKIPLKLLLLIVIFLFLAFFCFNAKEVKAATSQVEFYYNGQLTTATVNIPYGQTYYNNYVVLKSVSSNGYTRYLLINYATNSDLYIQAKNYSNVTLYFWTASYGSRISAHTYVYNGSTFNDAYGDASYFTDYTGRSSTPITYSYVGGNKRVMFMESESNITNTTGSFLPLPFTNPSITNSSDVVTWSFDNLIINSGSVKGRYTVTEDNIQYEYVRTFKLETTYQGVVYTTDLRSYMTIDNDGYATFTIPKNELSNHFNIYNGNSIMFDLFVQPDDNPNSTGNWSTYSLGTYTFTLTTDEQEQINSDSNKQVLGDINSSIQETNENLNNLNSNITDLNNSQEETNNKIDNLESSITSSDYSSSDLSNTMHNFGNGFVVTDNTHLEELFTMLYNAFCNNQVVNLTFTIPFVNKPVTISSENISSNYPTQLVTIVHLFVWGMIGVFIIKDIRTMINKMAEGNIENISSDVKKEVL